MLDSIILFNYLTKVNRHSIVSRRLQNTLYCYFEGLKKAPLSYLSLRA